MRRLFQDKNEARQAYDFYSNPKVTSKQLLKPHIDKTVARINACDCPYILAIQDTTVLNYTSHKAKTQIGRVSKSGRNRDQYGLFQHNTLCVSSKNEALGLIDLQYFHNDDFDTNIVSDLRPIEDKKTMCWINALNTVREMLKDSNKKIITVADRDGDFFEFLHELKNDLFVIRVQYDRCTGEKYNGEKLFDLLNKENPLGEVSIDINDVNTHEIKKISLKIKRLENISIPPSPRVERNNRSKEYQPVKVNVVQAYNENYCWILLTTLPVNDIAACKDVTKIYKERWHIEDYHKVLKTGYQVDELYLHASLSAIKNALTMAAVAACRLYWIIFTGRVESSISAEKFFKEHEWKALYVYFKEVIPEKSPALSEIIIKIAKLGGYKPGNEKKPPGIKTMWLGFQKFTVAAEMYDALLSTKT